MAQVRIENIKKKVAGLNKIKMEDIAFGRVENGSTQYHQDIEQIGHDLRVFARNISLKEQEYIKDKEDREAIESVMKVRNAVGGDMQKAVNLINKLSQNLNDSRNKHNEK